MEQTHDGTGTTERAMTVTEFLEARIAEDEAHANGWCEDDQPCYVEHPGHKAPARVLAECAAKRAIINELANDLSYDVSYIEGPILSHLAAVYADHPDYRQEWALG